MYPLWLQILEGIIFSGLIFAFILYLYLALKAKSYKSLEFQLSIFLIIWIIAEALRVMEYMGFIEGNQNLSLLGLFIHTISMVLFAFFISYRFLGGVSKK